MLENVPHTLEKNAYPAASGGLFCRYLLSPSDNVVFSASVSLVQLTSSFIPLWSEKLVGRIPIFLNLLRLFLWPSMWSILENVPYALEKNVCVLLHLGVEFCRCLLSPSVLVCCSVPPCPYLFSVWWICPLE